MEITETTKSVVWLSKIFGMAPYEIIRNEANNIVDLKLSTPMCAYSTIFMIIGCISSNWGLFYDMFSGRALRYLISIAKWENST